MPKLFANKYHTQTLRLQSWNYGDEAMYFVTLVTKDRRRYFGRISFISDHSTAAREPLWHPEEIGIVAQEEWVKTFELRKDMNLTAGAFVVMPDHIHFIIGIGSNPYNTHRPQVGVSPALIRSKDKQNQFGPQSKNLASIIRGYKSAVTMHARRNQIKFEWQSLYYEHIIRSAGEYERITNYIVNNPKNWKGK